MLIELLALGSLSTFMPAAQAAATTATVPQSPSSFDAQYAQARAWANGGQPELAIQAYSALLERSPGNADVLLGRGLVYSRTNRYAEAEADLLAASAAAPNYADVWLALGNLYRWTGRPAQAAEAYDRVLAIRPDDADARAGREALAQAAQAQAPQPAVTPPAAPGAAPTDQRPATPDALSTEFDWSASLSASATRVSLNSQRWNDQTIAVRRYTRYGSLGVEALSASRFDQRDHAWALDGYVALWPRAYANLRYQRAPVGRLFPDTSWRAELYQGVGNGWELSASTDRLDFDTSRVRIHGVGVAKYVGNFYLLLRHTDIKSSGSSSTGDRALVRYYYRGDADSYIEAAASRGRSDDPLSLSGGRSSSGERSVNFVSYVTRHWGYRVGATFARQDSGGRERGVSASLYRRW
ncbi:YaiO family outer membrane beta-barrel protein [Pseudoduganella sp. GCM10020061]|uniref:YaiO family outer membrane beta-barrel protein n=1 Tax=Pseudoduganella sp. GCM10020061 TaxID=3317345 RepID=UPI003625C77A